MFRVLEIFTQLSSYNYHTPPAYHDTFLSKTGKVAELAAIPNRMAWQNHYVKLVASRNVVYARMISRSAYAAWYNPL